MAAHGVTWPATLGRMLQLDIDRDSSIPPYRQVAALLAAAVRRGDLAPGDRLPSIIDIVQAAGVARLTAAKALRLLAAQGWAELSPGMGYYVPDRLPGAHPRNMS